MPRLLRTVARTAAIAGTASAVSGRVQRRQARKWGAEDAQAAPQQEAAYSEPEQDIPAQRSAPSTADTLEQLKSLGELKAQGVLTEEEFAAQKAKILAG